MQSPSDIARETLKTLATRKAPPTPGNYARIYAEISGIDDEKSTNEEKAGAEKVLRGIAEQLAQLPKYASVSVALRRGIGAGDWEQCIKELEKVLPKAIAKEKTQSWHELIRELLQQLEITHKGLTLARKKEGLENVLARFAANPEILFEKLNALIHSWAGQQTAANTIEIDASSEAAESVNAPVSIGNTSPVHSHDRNGEMLGKLSELLSQALESMLSMLPELAVETQELINQVRNSKTHEQIAALSKHLRQFWIKVELRAGDNAKIHDGLMRLLRLLVENMGEMIEDEDWLFGQIVILQEIIEKPMDMRVIADAERSLRNAIIKQGMLKQSLDDAKSTLKSLMTSFIDRLAELTESTGEYHQKIEGYSKKIGKSSNITELSHLLKDIMQDTRIIQASALRSHEELVGARKKAEEAEAKIKELEQELSQASELVQQDQLTGALNRRGMDAAFEREVTRADRAHHPLCVALLDIDNFKRLNDTLGHQAGDQALIHLSSVIKETLRPTDSVARYGGEEFVIILPEIGLEEASVTIERLQREMTKKFFLHENDRVLVTFSAGVAQRATEESQEEVIARADKAMYEAKKTGKNRVVIAK